MSRAEITPLTDDPGDVMEPEPEPSVVAVSPASSRTPGGGGYALANAAMAARGTAEPGTTIILESSIGWTTPAERTPVTVAPGEIKHIKWEFPVAGRVTWSIGVAAYEIHTHARFVKNQRSPVATVFTTKIIGDPYNSLHSSVSAGEFPTAVPGTLEIALDNSCARLSRLSRPYTFARGAGSASFVPSFLPGRLLFSDSYLSWCVPASS
jgi:hypothetical protein